MNISKIQIPSTKGNISAVIHNPEMKTEKLAVLCPGYLDSKDYKNLVGLGDALSQQGYTVVRFDPTGTWESDGPISDYTTTQYLLDIKNVISYMLSQSDFTHILLGGHSMGGKVSILYAAQDPKISVILGVASSPKAIVGARRSEIEKAGIRISQRDLPEDKNKTREFRVPFAHFLDSEKYDVIKCLKKIKVPIILIAGELDDVAPPNSVKEIFDNAKEPKRFSVVSGIDHDYRHNDNEVAKIVEKVLEQLNLI